MKHGNGNLNRFIGEPKISNNTSYFTRSKVTA